MIDYISINYPNINIYLIGILCLLISNLFIYITGTIFYYIYFMNINNKLLRKIFLSSLIPLQFYFTILINQKFNIYLNLYNEGADENVLYNFIIISTLIIIPFRFIYTILGYNYSDEIKTLGKWLKHLTILDPKRNKNKKIIFPNKLELYYSIFKFLRFFIYLSVTSSFFNHYRISYQQFNLYNIFDWLIIFNGILLIYLFLALIIEIARIVAILNNINPIEGFNSPLISVSPIEFWRKWNLLIRQILLRSIYLPLLKLGYSKNISSFITFIVSGLFHEVQYLLSFNNYNFGTISIFFLIQGFICSLQIISKKLLKHFFTIPNFIKWIISFIILIKTGQTLVYIFENSKMFQVISLITFQIKINYS